jgi:hypothetical protein
MDINDNYSKKFLKPFVCEEDAQRIIFLENTINDKNELFLKKYYNELSDLKSQYDCIFPSQLRTYPFRPCSLSRIVKENIQYYNKPCLK